MRRAEGLWISLLLLGFTNGGQPDQQQVLFSDGIQLLVEGTSNSTAPRVLVFLPARVEKTSQNVTLLCLARGLFAGLVDLTWMINDTVVTTAGSVAQVIREPNGSYTATGFLVIATTVWSPRNIYKCAAIQGSQVYEGSAQTSCFSDTS
ncbi:T-cell receptor beta-1 chain C region [Anguilla anguilla]|uniref:Ig-like domain-containing protein n=1 Tax=Anguilla anguilla TaxID=7936 RepID=A0A9D3ML53_ANGAN|nr:T-cell receptor beta-1 chain C region [Anguilla anguilla]KAG5850879.1 hypothetical protein ANANG_G00087070 [Anguilla anguilla]